MDIEKIALKLQEVADRAERNEGRIKKLESEHAILHQLATAVEVMAERMKTVDTNITNLTREVGELKEKPSKRWEAVVSNAISALVGAVLAYLFANIGL